MENEKKPYNLLIQYYYILDYLRDKKITDSDVHEFIDGKINLKKDKENKLKLLKSWEALVLDFNNTFLHTVKYKIDYLTKEIRADEEREAMRRPKTKEDTENEIGYYTVADLMNFFQVSKQTVHNWHKKGTLKGMSIGGSLRFKKKDIDNYNPKLKSK